MLTIDVEKTPAKVRNTTGMYPEWLKEFTLEYKATVNGEETSITAVLLITVSDNHWVVELPHQRCLLGNYMRGTVSQWLLDEGLLDPYYAVILKWSGRAYVYTEEEYKKIVHFLHNMSEQNKENNCHDHQH